MKKELKETIFSFIANELNPIIREDLNLYNLTLTLKWGDKLIMSCYVIPLKLEILTEHSNLISDISTKFEISQPAPLVLIEEFIENEIIFPFWLKNDLTPLKAYSF